MVRANASQSFRTRQFKTRLSKREVYRLSGWNQNIKNLPCIRLKRRPYFTYSDVRALRFKIIFHPFYFDFNFRHSRPVELIQMIDFEPQHIEYFAKPKTSCQFDRASTLDTFWWKERTPINYKLFANIKKNPCCVNPSCERPASPIQYAH